MKNLYGVDSVCFGSSLVSSIFVAFFLMHLRDLCLKLCYFSVVAAGADNSVTYYVARLSSLSFRFPVSWFK